MAESLRGSYLKPEFIASGRSRNFYKFIKIISDAKSKPEEADLVNNELQILSTKMNQPNVTSASMNEYLIELVHCALLGYDIDMGIIYAIMATQSGENVAQRRVGYLICTLFLNKHHDLSIMLINTLQRDLKSSNYLDTCAALNALCYFDHLEMSDHLLDPTIKAMESTRQIVRKKGVLALYWFYRRSPALVDQIEPVLKAALLDKDTSVVFVALEIWKKIVVDKAEQYQDLLPTFMQIHQQILGRYIHRGHMYHGVLAPWAQITCLQLYGIYQDHDIGSQKEIFDLVMKCLHCMENKVDAAYAIILECIKLLSAMDTLLLSSLISSDGDEDDYRTSPFYVLDPFLKANNHTMRYLGLTGLGYLKSTTLWHPDWKDGTLLANMILSSIDSSTLVKKVITVLDVCVATEQDLHRIGATILHSIRQCDNPEIIDLVSRWFIGKMDGCVDKTTEWWMETMLLSLAATKTGLDTGFMETQCHALKQNLLDELDDTKLRTLSVDTCYEILSTLSTNDALSPSLLQLAFWILGENAYLSTKFSEIDGMELLQKYIMLVQDNPLLQVCDLQAIKRCMMRSKSYLSGLEPILRSEFMTSPFLEKQQIAREIMLLVDDMDFVKEIQKSSDTDKTIQSRHIQANASERDGRKLISADSNQAIPYQDSPWHNRRHKDSPVHHPMKAMMSSLIDMEINDTAQEKMTTDTFGRLWLTYQHEQKLQLDAPPSLSSSSHYHHFFNDDDDDHDTKRTIQWLQEQWNIDVVETIQHECLATRKLSQGLVLIHIKMDVQPIQITLRSSHSSTLSQFNDFIQ